MEKHLKGLLIIIFTVFISLGWAWTSYLKDKGLIDENVRLYTLLAITILLTFQQIINIIPKPSERGNVEQRREIVEAFLDGFYDKYIESLEQSKPHDIRVNIMLITKKARGLFGTYLKIYYTSCPETFYTADEYTERWKKKVGNCGWAWAYGKMIFYDSNLHKILEKRMNESQKKCTEQIKSVLSVPIWYYGKVVGVLNIDSIHNIEDTKFNIKENYCLASACALNLASICFEYGVEE